MYTYDVKKSDGSDFLSASPAKDFVYLSVTNSLYIKTSDATKNGDYALSFQCTVNDGFTTTQSFSLKIYGDPPNNGGDSGNNGGGASNEEDLNPGNIAPVFT